MIRDGWTTFPIRPILEDGSCGCGKSDCTDAGKHPAVRHGRDHLPAGTQVPIPPGHGIGLATGERSGVVVLDVDRKDGKDGLEVLRSLGPIPETLIAKTPTGGLHIYFLWPGHHVQTNSNVLGPGLDVRADGGYVVLPPSPHKRGGVYEWVDEDAEIVDAPAWLLERFRAWNEERERRHTLSPAPELQGDFAGLPLDERKRRAAEWIREKPGACEGRINPGERYSGGTQTFVNMMTLVRGHGLPPAEAFEVAQAWNERCSPPWDAPDLRRKVQEAADRGDMPWGALLPRIRSATEGFVALTADELLAPVPAPRFHVEALGIAPGRPVQLVGMGFSGKTILGQSAAIATITGTPLWGEFPCRRGPVGWLDYEMGRNPLLRRFRRLALGIGWRWEDVAQDLSFCSLPKTKLNSDDAEEHLLRFADGLTACFVDSLRRATPGTEENDSDIARWIDQLLRVSELTGCVFWFLHHSSTKKPVDGLDARGAGRGSSAIYDSSGTVLSVSGKPSEPMICQQTRCGEGMSKADTFTLSIEDVEIDHDPRAGLRVIHGVYEGAGDEPKDAETAIFEAIKGCNFRGEAVCSNDALVAMTRLGRNRVVAARGQLEEQGKITNLGKPSRPRYWVLDEDGNPWTPRKEG